MACWGSIQTTPLPLFRLELLARPSHLPFLAMDRRDGDTSARTGAGHYGVHAAHSYGRTYLTYASDLECHPIYETGSRCDEFSRRGRRPTSTPRIRSSSTNGPIACTRSVPSLVDDPAQADRGTCCGPQLSASDRRKPARSRVPSLRFCAPRTPARGAGIPVPAPQRTAASLVGSGICGEVVVQCEPSGPRPRSPTPGGALCIASRGEPALFPAHRGPTPSFASTTHTREALKRIAGSYAHARATAVLTLTFALVLYLLLGPRRPLHPLNRLPSSGSSATAAIEFAACTD